MLLTDFLRIFHRRDPLFHFHRALPDLRNHARRQLCPYPDLQHRRLCSNHLHPLDERKFYPAAILAILAVIPVSYVIERYVIRRLYGESLDYTFIATFAITLMGVDTIKWVWG